MPTVFIFSDSFFISEPEGGKSCSNSPAPEPGVSRKDIIDNIRKSGGNFFIIRLRFPYYLQTIAIDLFFLMCKNRFSELLDLVAFFAMLVFISYGFFRYPQGNFYGK